MSLPEKIAAVLSPHLGAHSADAVARHVCAKYAAEDRPDAATLQRLRDFLRRGLVAYVGPGTAEELANACIDSAAAPEEPTS
jgi:hypothetical protein